MTVKIANREKNMIVNDFDACYNKIHMNDSSMPNTFEIHLLSIEYRRKGVIRWIWIYE